MKQQNYGKHLVTLLALLLMPLASGAQQADAGAAAPAKDSSDKLNLKMLEDKYWSAKDTDFNVVQNRTYAKDHRFYISGSYGVLMNDSYSYGRMENWAFGYYPSERWGIELAHEVGWLKPNSSVSALETFNGLRPNYNEFKTYTSLNFLWVPFYAKMSFMNRQILYFDMQFAAGLGTMTYQHQIDPAEGGPQNDTTTAFNLDVTQQLFFSEHFAIRLDIKNKWSKQQLDVYRLAGSQFPTRTSPGSMGEQDTTILLGITYFFGSGKE